NKNQFTNLRGTAVGQLGFALMFAAYLFNPADMAIGIAFATLFVLSVVFVIMAFAHSGMSATALIQLSLRSVKIQAAAVIILCAIIASGLIQDSWRETLSGISFAAAIVVLFFGCTASSAGR
ncbi:MAG: hypothetical protein HDT06_00930, partial [Bacteroidales bacterium]|nr:hypothetical protein [Bacteroidales bacterium]